jgi:hypothetical protein
MHKLTFFNIGNADSCLIQLENGRNALFDFADMHDPDDKKEKRCDLEAELRSRLGDDKELDVVAFTHLDRDHTRRSSEVFHLEHAQKYQGEGRIRIKTLWVPAAAILEEGVEDEARIIRQEARHRLIEGKGVRVFSRPEILDDWLRERDIEPAKRRNMISDAGTLCPEFDLHHDGAEFFVHSPFAEHCEDGSLVVRNGAALFMQATFEVEGQTTRLILSADVPHGVIEDIVRITKAKQNDDRLLWDVNNIPHHCSYLSLADEKGKDKTEPSKRLKWLYETQGRIGGLIVSTSCEIPTSDTTQPPHRQAANYYRGVAKANSGSFLVTMEHPSISGPKPMEIEIRRTGATLRKAVLTSSAALLGNSAPRAGRGH